MGSWVTEIMKKNLLLFLSFILVFNSSAYCLANDIIDETSIHQIENPNTGNVIAKVKSEHLKAGVRTDRILFNNGIKNFTGIGKHTFIIPADKKLGSRRSLRKLAKQGLFEYVEADHKIYVDGSKKYTTTRRISVTNSTTSGSSEPSISTNDQYFSSQYHLSQIKANKAWNYSKGGNVTVAVIDSGVDANHPDLAGRVVGRENHPEDTLDVYGHGTKVAGVIAANTNNEVGVAGVGWDVSIHTMRVTDDKGLGSISSIVQALEDVHQAGIKIVQISLSTPSDSASLRDAVALAQKRGILIVSTSGNTFKEEIRYPAAYPGVIGVGSVSNTNTIENYSTRGSHVGLVAPGSGILTTRKGTGYSAVTGTSFASPQISGVAALMLAINPKLTSAQIRTILFQTATDLGTSGKDTTYGYGLLNALKAVKLSKDYSGSNSLRKIKSKSFGYSNYQNRI